jgi:septum formation topological specificity factor MinE
MKKFHLKKIYTHRFKDQESEILADIKKDIIEEILKYATFSVEQDKTAPYGHRTTSVVTIDLPKMCKDANKRQAAIKKYNKKQVEIGKISNDIW